MPEGPIMTAVVVHKIAFTAPPAPGTLLMIDGQRFEVAGLVAHCRRDGQQTVLINWTSHCARCGRPFSQITSMTAKAPNRRCPAHHAPGVPVTAGGRERKRQFLGRHAPENRVGREFDIDPFGGRPPVHRIAA